MNLRETYRNKCHEWKYRKLKEESSNSIFAEAKRSQLNQVTNINSGNRNGSPDEEREETNSSSRSVFPEYDISRPMLSYWHRHHYELRKLDPEHRLTEPLLRVLKPRRRPTV
ncbi:hypothetical protein TNIN_243061 [Trichonephila inaurata madagascariensis]|uniref:Uncharacterized protein n=1 Tax=Trichonephila inaurata madagascariensis TaxID=2747483 RepID=A0A8X6XRX8_9ARAC|nr:hypothetical protein TNIN_243061 [Trichonephila inaurata madagascariensis]